MTFEESIRAGRERVERERCRDLIVQTCAMAMVKTRKKSVHDAACDVLRRMGAITADEHRRLLKSWSDL